LVGQSDWPHAWPNWNGWLFLGMIQPWFGLTQDDHGALHRRRCLQDWLDVALSQAAINIRVDLEESLICFLSQEEGGRFLYLSTAN
jgi:hypothetical protein